MQDVAGACPQPAGNVTDKSDSNMLDKACWAAATAVSPAAGMAIELSGIELSGIELSGDAARAIELSGAEAASPAPAAVEPPALGTGRADAGTLSTPATVGEMVEKFEVATPEVRLAVDHVASLAGFVAGLPLTSLCPRNRKKGPCLLQRGWRS